MNIMQQMTIKAENVKATTRQDHYEKVQAILRNGKLEGEVQTTADGKITVDIEWGDWKHEHGYLKYLMNQNGYIHLSEEVTEEDGSDCYSASHTFMFLTDYIRIKKNEIFSSETNYKKVMGV